MAAEEDEHRRPLIEEHRRRFGDVVQPGQKTDDTFWSLAKLLSLKDTH